MEIHDVYWKVGKLILLGIISACFSWQRVIQVGANPTRWRLTRSLEEIFFSY